VDVYAAPQVATAGRVLAPGWVAVESGEVTGVGDGTPPDAGRLVSLPDGLLAAGLVDIQLNGAFGVDFAAARDDAAWLAVLDQLPETGCTSVVPTLITAPVDELADAIRAYAGRSQRLAARPGAARVLGLHLEGPFLSERRRGAHRADLLCDPTAERVDALLAAATDGALCYVTLAPERDHALEAIRRLRGAGVRVAVGHSDATDAQVRAAADAGATGVTHLFNAQRPLRHRDPGVVGAALSDPRLTLGLIVDLHHVYPTAVAVAFAAASGRVALVTDAAAAMGMPAGVYELGGEPVRVEPGHPPLRADGTIAGSAVRMDEALANAVDCGVPLPVAVDAATRVPADAVGRADLGRLEPGAAADLVWLGPDLFARATWVAGRLAWTGPDAAPLLGATVAEEVR
jgi:N-acetylglucosamine-6-phosphate deacetylase